MQLTLVTGEPEVARHSRVEDAVDFLEDVPGEEYKLIAKNISGEIIEAGLNGFIAEVKVIRDTLLRFEAGVASMSSPIPTGASSSSLHTRSILKTPTR